MSPFDDLEGMIIRLLETADGSPGFYYFIRPVVSAPAGEVTPRKGDA